MSNGVTQGSIEGPEAVDLVDLAAILIRRAVLILVVSLLCVAAALFLHFRPSANMFVVTGSVQIGTVPAPRVVVQNDVTMNLLIYDSPMTVLEPVIEGPTAKFYTEEVAVPLAVTEVVPLDLAKSTSAFDVEVVERGNIVGLTMTVSEEDREAAVEIIGKAIDMIVMYCRSKEKVQGLWLDSLIEAQAESPGGERMRSSLSSLVSSIEGTRVLGPSMFRPASSSSVSLPIVLAIGTFVGLSVGVVVALVLELFVRGCERNRRLTA